jgi:hypothetical protein
MAFAEITADPRADSSLPAVASRFGGIPTLENRIAAAFAS